MILNELLRSDPRAEILIKFHKTPAVSISLNELAREVGLDPEDVEKDLFALMKLGLVQKERGYRLNLTKDKEIQKLIIRELGLTKEQCVPTDLIQIRNVVALGSLGHRLELNSIAEVVPEAKYRPNVFPALVYRLKRPRAALLIFESGKIVCSGAKSERQAVKAIKSFVNQLREKKILILGNPIIRVKNVVASAKLLGNVDLERASGMLDKAIYEPDQFPALILRMEKPKVSLLLFASGNVVCAGARGEREARLAVKLVKRRLEAAGLLSKSRQASEGLNQPLIV